MSENKTMNQEKKYHMVVCKNCIEHDLLQRIAYFVTDKKDNIFRAVKQPSGQVSRCRYMVLCTTEEAEEINLLYGYYLDMFNERVEDFYRSFIQEQELLMEEV